MLLALPGAPSLSDLGDIRIEEGTVYLPVPFVFVAYAKEDRDAVRTLADRLWNDAFQVWLDERDLLPGDDWQRRIDEAIKASDSIVVAFSNRSCQKTGQFQREIRRALQQYELRPLGARFLIPLRLEPCELPVEFRAFNWVNIWEADGYVSLCRSLRSLPIGRPSAT